MSLAGDGMERLIRKARRVLRKLLRRQISKREYRLRFHSLWRQFPDSLILTKLRQYWLKYRFFGEIEKIVSFKDKQMLDVGCGAVTSVLRIVENGAKYGIDPMMSDYGRIYDLDKNITWITAVAENLPFKPYSFDIVFSSNALDHFDNPSKAIKEIERVLKPDGFLILTVDIFPSHRTRDIGHPHSFTEHDVLELLEGFEIKFIKKSELGAVFYYYLKGKIPKHERKELVVVAKRSKGLNER